MVEMARALVLDPMVLLLDEPTLGLSPGMSGAVLAQVQALRAAGRTVLIVEQNAKRALEIADRGYVLDAGRTRFEDTGQNLLRNDEVKRLYLGVA
jgi:ABC-type branched-subunit amino acid transport system ATPase component